MLEPRFVIVGTGRHGSKWAAEAMTAGGIPTGHESWWGWNGAIPDEDYIGDSSWFAAPHLSRYDGVVFHQVRHPLNVMNSLIKSPDLGYAWKARLQEMPIHGDAVEIAISIVLHWYEICSRYAVLTWRLEDGIPEEVGNVLHIPFDTEAANAQESSNWHGDAAHIWTWETLPESPLKLELMRLAEREGYL